MGHGNWVPCLGEVEEWGFEPGFLALRLEVRPLGPEPDGEGSGVAWKLLEPPGATGWGGLQPSPSSGGSRPVGQAAPQAWGQGGMAPSGLLPVGSAGGWGAASQWGWE